MAPTSIAGGPAVLHCGECVVETVRKRMGPVRLIRCVAVQHGGRGHKVAYVESSEQVAAAVNTGWRAPDGGCVAAMDFSKAFDHMAPELSQQALVAAGWPEHLATLLGGVWKAQERTVFLGGHQDQTTFKTTFAHGPLGPSVCQVWLLGGAEWTAEQQRNWTKFNSCVT